MICSNCGTRNEAGRKFCIECAARLAPACPNCGTANPPSAKFCGECATPLTGVGGDGLPEAGPGGSGAGRGAAVAERRLVSILFADLVGFTPFAEERDAEDVRETLSRYFELASEVIGRYGGTVEKFIGDAVMAVWGAPTARENDAELAVRAGLDLVGAVRELSPGIQARAAVLTGEAAVTLGATNQGMVAGDLVNTAARLQSVAPPGSILVDEATHRAASRAITFEEAGAQVLKGKTAPVTSWRALRVVAEVGGRNRSETLEAPFVGRDDELRLLRELFHATAREGRARLVSVVGPAGIGKTRLAWEFLKYLDGLVEGVWYHEGRSPAYGEGVSFWALGEMIRRRAGLKETDDERTTRDAVARMLVEHVPEADERRWIEPAVLSLLGVDVAVDSNQLFSAWRTFFERLTATSPVVLVFEDFHFADSGLIEFVDHLLEWSRQVPIYVVTLSRPELLEKRPDWGAGKRNFTSLYLEPLTSAAMREMLTGLIAGLPEPAIAAIVARADGIPLYAVETVRMLLADGQLALEGASYRPTGDLHDLAVPETLTALIASRLDTLDPLDRTLIQDAAVLGQSFTLAGLAAVAGAAEDDLEPRLRSLTRRELLRVEADPRSPERGQFVFVQALIREVAYNMLARAERKTRHVAAARYFEALGSDELAGALAGHYLAAVANAAEGPERDALAGQARIALRAAADRAAALGAHDQALRYCEEALTVATEPSDRALLHELAGESATALSRMDDVETHFRAAIEHRVALGDRSGEADATASYGSALLTAYTFRPALELLAAGSRRFADVRDDPAVIRLDGQLARAYFLNDDDPQAIAVSDRVLEAAERADLIDIVADTLVTRGSALGSLGRRYEGLGAIEAGRRLAGAHSLLRTEHRALNNLASFLMDEDPRAALEAAREGIALAARLGDRTFQLMDNAVGAATRLGEWDWALALVEAASGEEFDPVLRAVALADTIGIRALRDDPTAELIAEIESLPTRVGDDVKQTALGWATTWSTFAAGDWQASRAAASRLAGSFSQGAGEAYLIAARCALHAGDAGSAHGDLANVEATRRRGRAFGADEATVRAGIAALEGRPAEALAGYREVLAVWRDLGVIWDEALCVIDMATLLDPTLPEVRAAGEAAREILIRLRASPFIDRLDTALSRASAPPQAAARPSRESSAPASTV